MHAIRLPTAAIHLPVLTAEAVNAEHLWIVTDECATTGARLWHTSDGGRHWQRHRIRGTNCAAGSTDNLAFTDARHGLLTVIVANAPGADLYRTGDGGRHWQHVASMNGDDRAALPIDGAVEQAGDGSLWLAGATCSSRLWKSAGVGDKWQKLDLPGVRGPKYLAPSVLDSVIVQPVSTVRTCSSNRPQRLNIFRSSDTGQHWTRLPVHLPVRARAARKARVDLTATSATHFWLTDHTNQGDRLFESRDAGKGWRTINLSALSNNRSGED